MGAAMTRCVAARSRAKRFANANTARCPRPMRARNRAPFSPLARGLRRAALRQPLEPAVTARTFATKVVSRHPGDLPAGQDLSLFINTLKINRSGIILAFY